MKIQILFFLMAMGLLNGCSKVSNADEILLEKVSGVLKKLEKNHKLWSLPLGNDDLCWSLFESFKSKKNIKLILPNETSNEYDNLPLKKFLPKCEEKKYNVDHLYSPNMLDFVKNMKPEEKERFAKKVTITSNFKLYKINIDGKQGEEVVLYGEKRVNEDLSVRDQGGYIIISPKTCNVNGGMFTYDPYDYEQKLPLNNYNGLIRYEHKYYIFDLWQFRHKSSLYKLSVYGTSKTGKFGSMCSIGKDIRKEVKK